MSDQSVGAVGQLKAAGDSFGTNRIVSSPRLQIARRLTSVYADLIKNNGVTPVIEDLAAGNERIDGALRLVWNDHKWPYGVVPQHTALLVLAAGLLYEKCRVNGDKEGLPVYQVVMDEMKAAQKFPQEYAVSELHG